MWKVRRPKRRGLEMVKVVYCTAKSLVPRGFGCRIRWNNVLMKWMPRARKGCSAQELRLASGTNI